MNMTRRTAVTGLALMVSTKFAAAKNLPELNLSSSGLALRGYDPVAYFTQGQPVMGDASLALSYKGGTYHFASAEHQQMFVENPERFLPQYGGYCAYGTAVGAKVDGDPNLWTIVDDKLYLNITRSIDRVWHRNKPRYISDANKNWPGLQYN